MTRANTSGCAEAPRHRRQVAVRSELRKFNWRAVDGSIKFEYSFWSNYVDRVAFHDPQLRGMLVRKFTYCPSKVGRRDLMRRVEERKKFLDKMQEQNLSWFQFVDF